MLYLIWDCRPAGVLGRLGDRRIEESIEGIEATIRDIEQLINNVQKIQGGAWNFLSAFI